MKKKKGMFTVEAAVLVPVLIFLTLFCVYVLSYCYDYILVSQELNAKASRMQVGKSLDDHTVAESEPIYIIIKDLNYSISEYKGKTIIKAEYFCINPIWNIGNAKTTIIREINFIDRVENMIAHDKLLKPEE